MTPEDFAKIREFLSSGGGVLKAKENRENVVRTTFKTDEDGNNYGVGTDGNTYSYNMINDQVKNLRPLTVEEQRYAINKFSDGNVEVDEQVTNQTSLTDILKSVVRMYDKGGTLAPERVNISDMRPGSYIAFGAPAGVTTHPRYGGADEIKINGLSLPNYRRGDEEAANKEGWWPDRENKALGEGVITHELSHSTQNAMSGILERWLEKKEEEAEANKNKYPADKLFVQAVSRLFGNDYELGEEDTVGYKILQDAYDKYNKWSNEIGNSDKGDGGLRIISSAAKNLGFDSVKEAADSISGYAGKRYKNSLRIDGKEYEYEDVKGPEVFAEAYTDVLLNDEDAAPFSKEIIRLYKEYADDLSNKTGWRKSDPFKEFKEMFTILPKADFAAQVQRSKRVLKNGGKK